MTSALLASQLAIALPQKNSVKRHAGLLDDYPDLNKIGAEMAKEKGGAEGLRTFIKEINGNTSFHKS
jgi:hypothetical protein